MSWKKDSTINALKRAALKEQKQKQKQEKNEDEEAKHLQGQ